MVKKLIFLVCVFFASLPIHAETGLKLTNISIKEGLSNLNVSAVAEDQLGYIWVATMRGLNRYNGSEFTHFYNNPKDSLSLNSSHINALHCTKDGHLYIGMASGINVYNLRKEKISNPFPEINTQTIRSFAEKDNYIYVGANSAVFRFQSGSHQLEYLGTNWPSQLILNRIFFDGSGILWVCFDNDGALARYNEKNDTFDFYRMDESSGYDSNNSIKSVFQYSDDLFILSTNNGVAYFNTTQRKFVRPAEFSVLSKGLEGHEIQFILEKEPQLFWIGTYRSGIFVYDKRTDNLTRHFLNDISSEIHSNTYIDYFTDSSGNVWLATFDAGLDVSYRQARNFNFDPYLNQLTRNRFVTGIAEDKNGRLIIATREDGFYTFNPETKEWKNYNQQNSGLKYPYIRSIYVDSQNKYWIGHHYGLQLFYPGSEHFKTLPVPEPNNGVVTILEMGKFIFAGTDRHGLLVFDVNGELIRQIVEPGINITKIIRLNDYEVIFCSYGVGIYVMNINTLIFSRLPIDNTGPNTGIYQSITLNCTDGRHLWLGTYSYGLFLYDLITGEIKNFSVPEGLPSSDIVGIENDGDGALWISTSYGLARFNINDYTVQTFLMNEGLNNYQFHEKSSFRDQNGVLYFGGNLGVSYFMPAEIKTVSNNTSKIILEKLYLLDKTAKPGNEKSTLSEALPFTEKITLTHKNKLFSIDYVAFDFLSSGTLQYYTMLEGFDKNWYFAGKQRRVTYSNLSRGDYIFKVKAKNGAGVWSENQAELLIHVKPAPWFSYGAWVVYFMFISWVIYFIFKMILKNVVYRKELDIEHYEHQREREIHSMKQRFFSNISHELRTPLTMIAGMTRQLTKQEKLTPQVRQITQSLESSVDRLLKLVNQLLAFKKLESDKLTLWLELGCINEALQKIVYPFILFAKAKNIRIELEENDIYQLYFDFDKLEKIMSNLLSNAIKYTDEGGTIKVELHRLAPAEVSLLYPAYNTVVLKGQHPFIEILVTDTGCGIEEQYWTTIFDRYGTIDSGKKLKPDYSNSGIGLNFTKSLVELNKGAIRVESQHGIGSTFAFILPSDPDVYDQDDFAGHKEAAAYKEYSPKKITVIQQESKTDSLKTILVAEDDPDLNLFIQQILTENYEVLTCFNGEVAFDQVIKKMPDIVLADVMMPGITGFELTRQIKQNAEICHIPVILLTARSETSSQIEGLNCGADAYVSKPFDMDYLLAVISSQLKNRQRIQEIFLSGKMPVLNRVEVSPLDLRFLSKFNMLLDKELSNPDLDISYLASNLNMSRSSFYRKFLSLTSLTPISYIRKCRINKSIELISSGMYSLREVSEMTGFSSPSYFSTAFKQEQNITPTDYINQIKAS
jgi:signal transduction histidine kinase/ligand-binding sensor domain-containing protein/DNA-binding response OmpR family regulator